MRVILFTNDRKGVSVHMKGSVAGAIKKHCGNEYEVRVGSVSIDSAETFYSSLMAGEKVDLVFFLSVSIADITKVKQRMSAQYPQPYYIRVGSVETEMVEETIQTLEGWNPERFLQFANIIHS